MSDRPPNPYDKFSKFNPYIEIEDSRILRHIDEDELFDLHIVTYNPKLHGIQYTFEVIDRELSVELPLIFMGWAKPYKELLLKDVYLRAMRRNGKKYSIRVSNLMKNKHFLTRYRMELQHMEPDFISNPAGPNTWQYFWKGPYKIVRKLLPEKLYEDARMHMDLRFRRTRPSPGMPVLTVEPVAKWIVMDQMVFTRWFRNVEEHHFLFYVAFLCIMDYNRQSDKVDMVKVAEHIQLVENWEYLMKILASYGVVLPYGICINDVKNPHKKKLMGSRMVYKMKSNRLKPINTDNTYKLIKYFDLYHNHVFIDSGELSARERAMDAYKSAISSMSKFRFQLNAAMYVKMDYFPTVTPTVIEYRMSFELYVDDTCLGTIEEIKVDENRGIVKMKLVFMTIEFDARAWEYSVKKLSSFEPNVPESFYEPNERNLEDGPEVDIDLAEMDRALAARKNRMEIE